MHPNQSFRNPNDAGNIAFAQDRGFGVLAVNHDDGPLIAHIPFALNDAGTVADLHLIRSNPILRCLDTPQNAVSTTIVGWGFTPPSLPCTKGSYR